MTLRVDTIQNEAGTGPVDLYKQSAAKAWANLDGTGTIALRDSFNISSVTDTFTGDYTFNFSNSFAADEYAVSYSLRYSTTPSAADARAAGTVTPSSSSQFAMRMAHGNTAAYFDSDRVSIISHGDLA